MKHIYIQPYNKYSKGARALRDALKERGEEVCYNIAYSERSQVWTSEHPNFLLLNWGSQNINPSLRGRATRQLNKATPVSRCSNKWRFFENMRAGSVRIPEVTNDLDLALEWVTAGKEVLGREYKGSCGLDIVFFQDDPEKFRSSNFWSVYKKKKEEYRIHIFNNEVICCQRKALRISDPDTGEPIDRDTVDFRIRNHRNGFIFQRQDLSVPDDVIAQAIKAVEAANIDFGAVDIIYNAYENKAYVLEINTAPGLEGSTVNDYVGAILKAAQ